MSGGSRSCWAAGSGNGACWALGSSGCVCAARATTLPVARWSASCAELGIAGVRRGKRTNPVDADPRETRPADLVDRHFARFRTNQLWVADFTYVWSWSGWVYVAFVFDVHSRRILGWRAATRMTTPLVLDCLEMAFWTRRREGVADFAGLTHHTDAGSVYTSIAFTDRLIEEGIDPSVGIRRRRLRQLPRGVPDRTL